MKSINDLGASVLFPVMLSAYQTGNRTNLKDLFSGLLVTYVRYIVIAGLESSRFEDVIFALAKRIKEGLAFVEAINTLKDLAPNDNRFKEAFKQVSISDSSTARYILREIESRLRTTEELEVSTPMRVHVEHIYPQTPLEGNRWARHMYVVHRLGNLTLLSRRLNSSIKNALFDQKKPAYQASEIIMTNQLFNLGSWDENQINQRQERLSESAAQIWSFPS